MSPSGGTTGAIHFKIYRILSDWLESHEELGYIVDSSVGFRLPDKSVLAPDAAFVTKEKWESLTPEQQEKFPPLCPDFIIEVRSPSDSLPQLKLKMDDWVSNGCRLAWLIDPIKKNAYVYKKDGLIKAVATFDEKLEGFDVMPDLQMDLKKLYI